MTRSAYIRNGLVAFSSLAVLTAALAPRPSWACACGCGIFEVGTANMFPNGAGGMVLLEDDYMDQNKNWHGTSQAAAGDNGDKEIRTNFFKAGAQYMFNRSWGAQIEVPIWSRYFQTDLNYGHGAPDIENFNHTSLGDIRITGYYTGFSEDLSSGFTYGVKLPTGQWNQAGFDRDTQIGTGSTDLLLGYYHFGSLAANGDLGYIVQINLDQPVFTQQNYQPGTEIDTAAGVFYQGIHLSPSAKLVPIFEVLASVRGNDNGEYPQTNGGPDTTDSGYQRLIAAPGVEADFANYRVFADVEAPFYQNINGDQLVASVMYKLSVSIGF